MGPHLTIDLFSDVVCPWCYIGARRLDAARSTLAAPSDEQEPVDVTLRLHAFQLDPEADPNKTEPVVDAYARKFGGRARADQILSTVTATARTEGLEFRMERALRANTLRAHRLIAWAGDSDGALDPWVVKRRIMQAYFTDGENISDIGTLARLAADLGASGPAVEAMLRSDAYLADVGTDLNAAANAGVTAVPTSIVNEQWAIPGAQDTDTLVRVLRRVAFTGS